jgi:hypothetical protein
METKHKEREVKQNTRVVDSQITTKWTIQKSNDKHARVEFTTTSSTTTMWKVRE